MRWGLRDDAVSDAQIETIADAAGGDARVAISTLRVAARNAKQDGLDTISDAKIEQAVSEAKTEIQQKTLEKLNTHQRLIYEIIAEHSEITPGDLYESYEKRASDPRSKRMVRNYLEKLCHYNLIVATGENRGRTYHVVS